MLRLEVGVDRGVDAWLAWKQRWDDFVMLTGLDTATEAFQMARLRSCLGDDTLRIVRNLDLPERERTVHQTVLDKLRVYFLGQVNEVVERRNFNLRCQLEGESFEDFFVALRELSATCNFCAQCRDSLTRDRIVVGLRDPGVMKKLGATPNLTLASAVNVCRAEEAAQRDVIAIVGEGVVAGTDFLESIGGHVNNLLDSAERPRAADGRPICTLGMLPARLQLGNVTTAADIHFVQGWVPSHCGVDENERADQIAKEATALPQAAVPVDVATAHRAAARLARDRTIAAWPEGWYRTLMENRLPPPAATGDRSSAVDVHQLRAGH
ncbi:hypothetical protein FJT64_024334 [Amphibalanus amphitrite]|uniref:RNase H type-1 domain-containing protein n=1 Tax=Amphibalanus amphitrite TaxID=1232801 RepID=A0A6A4W7K0_AMPAM|nr:hypothetical protein FJT64_024334 [Amphibalanus amphitrite]